MSFPPMSVPYNYKFGGKELQETGFYDFGARNYMPDLGRWFNIDPLAELMPDLTPFRYAFNNPILYTDPNGMYEGGDGDWDEENDSYEENGSYEGNFSIDFSWDGAHSGSDFDDIINFRWDLDRDFALGSGGDENFSLDFSKDFEGEFQEEIQEFAASDHRDDSTEVATFLSEFMREKQDDLQREPTVTNNSNYRIYILHTVENYPITLQPGEKFYNQFDGVAMPHLYKNEILKVADFNTVVITNKDYEVKGTKLLGSFAQFAVGGLKDKAWLQSFEGGVMSTPRGIPARAPTYQYSLDHWGALFKVLGLKLEQ